MVHHLAAMGNDVDYWTDAPLSYALEPVLKQPASLRSFVYHDGKRALAKTPRQLHPLDLHKIINEHGDMDLQDLAGVKKPYDLIFTDSQTGIDMGVPLKQILGIPLVVQILDVPYWRINNMGFWEIYRWSVVPLPNLPSERFDGYRNEWNFWFSQLPQVDAVTTIINVAKEQIIQYARQPELEKRLFVSYHGSIDGDTFDHYLSREKVEKKNQVLVMNRIDFHKGVDQSVYVASLIQQAMGNRSPYFVFISKGNEEWYEQEVKELAQKALRQGSYRFTGWVDNPTKIRLLRESKVLLDNEIPEGFGGCLATGSLIVTNPGVKPIEQVHVGDKVLAEDGDYHTVDHVFEREYDGMVNIIRPTSYAIPVQLTPEHPVLIKKQLSNGADWRRKKLSEPQWVQVKDVQKGDYALFPIPSTNKNAKSFNIGTYRIPVSEDSMKFIGYFIGEGSASGNKTSFYFGKDQSAFADEVKNLAWKLFGLECRRERRLSVEKATINSKTLTYSLKTTFGALAPLKHIPKELMELPPNLQKFLLLGLYLSDGCVIKGRGYGFKTSSVVLAHQVWILLLRLGVVSYIQTALNNERSIDGRSLPITRYYSVTIAPKGIKKLGFFSHDSIHRKRLYTKSRIIDGVLHMRIASNKTKRYSGMVHNLSVDGKNSFTPGFVVHNCVIAEALYTDCHPLVWDRRSKREVYPKGPHFIPYGDFEAMARRAIEILSDDPFLDPSRESKRFVREFRSNESHAKSLLEIFRTVLAQQR